MCAVEWEVGLGVVVEGLDVLVVWGVVVGVFCCVSGSLRRVGVCFGRCC